MRRCSGVGGPATCSAESCKTASIRVRTGNALQVIATVAGGYIGDGAQAPQSNLNLTGNTAARGAISFDAEGNLYIADSRDYRIRKVSSTGTITTFAGSGISGYSGDGGPATNATIQEPYGIAVDQHDNVFISDSRNKVVRKVDSRGTITRLSPARLAARTD